MPTIGVLYQAENLNAVTPVLVTKFVRTARNSYVHGSWGTSQDNSTVLAACASHAEPATAPAGSVSPIAYTSGTCQQVSEFDYANITLRGHGSTPLALDDASLTPDMAVDGSPAVVDTQDSLHDVSPYPGNTTLSTLIAALGAVHRAHLTGNSFQLFTADSIG